MFFKDRKLFIVRFALTLVLLAGALGATQVLAEPVVSNSLYLSLANGKTIGGVSSADEDILRFDGTNWILLFDGSDVGVAAADLFAFSIMDEDTLLMAFDSAVTVNGISATPQDILRFDATSLGSSTAGTFSLYFDGSDVGLSTTAENIDSLSLLPDGRLLISTTGNPSVPGLTTGGRDEDVLTFTPTSLGDVTSGTWSLYFDGSDVGLGETSGEDVDALDVVGENIYLSTLGDFSVSGLSGADEDVFVCAASSVGSVTACDYSPALYFDGSTWGLESNDVDALNFLQLAAPTITILMTSPNPSPLGEIVTATVNVSPISGSGMPTGTVDISVDGINICNITLVDGTGSCSIAFYKVGLISVTATYNGDAHYLSSTSVLSHEVLAAPPTPTATLTPFYTPTFTPTIPTITSTPVLSCNSIRDSVGTLVVAGETMYLDIPNANPYPVTIAGVRVGWNYANGHRGANSSLRLLGAALNGTTFWTGDENIPIFQIPLPTSPLVIPANGTSRITFTFDQTYDRLIDEGLYVTFSTPGCESYPIDVTVAVEE